MKVAEIRSRFLKFFEQHGHKVVESSSLVPHNDPTLLFTNAGMVQFKDVFTGQEKRPYSRAVTVQKCVRAGGKHNDLENVGFTARHHTFFEMLGNFSFGDYFKRDAIKMAWDFVTKELRLPLQDLYVTVYKDDDEAFDIWEKEVGVAKERIYRFGEKDNFWSMGDTGPCGPCSELFVDRGPQYGCKQPSCAMGCDCDRYMEFWNLVFMQYERHKDGSMTPLPRPSVDTGAGLERLASILQKVDSNYETDVFRIIIEKTAKLVGKPYTVGTPDMFPFRVIADHARATAFLIADGVMPSNEGRGYVLRRIMRRAIRYGRNLGFSGPFLHKVCRYVVEEMGEAYPELKDKITFMEKAVTAEEEQFFRTLEKGLALLDDEMAQARSVGQLSGEVAFKLYDTFGFPIDLTRIICAENKLTVDEPGFERAMEEQKSRSRQNWKGSGEQAVQSVYHQIAERLREAAGLPKFVGFERLQGSGRCVALVQVNGAEKREVDLFTTPAKADEHTFLEAVFDTTPFYGEGGGQVGDVGFVSGEDFAGDVVDVQKPVPELIVARIKPLRGSMRLGATYKQEVRTEVRQLTARNHTATHMLHWALRKVLGDHVKQAGSLVTPEMLRFDFSHFEAVSREQLLQIEDMINERIWAAAAVTKQEMGKDEAVKAGAIAFFGEKYGDVVRVVKVGDYSTELCGGCHVDNTAEINLFKITTETSIAAGVRRIIALTSSKAFQYLRERDEEMRLLKDKMKATSGADILTKIEKLQILEKDLKKQLEKFASDSLGSVVDDVLAKAVPVGATPVVAHVLTTPGQGVKEMRDLAERLTTKRPEAVVLLGAKDEAAGKAFLLAAVGKKAPAQVKANELIAAIQDTIEGRGGGKPDMAQAGGPKMDGITAARDKFMAMLQQMGLPQ